jgi:prepilin-type N-terminal cleavage/methylation domain-containing protein
MMHSKLPHLRRGRRGFTLVEVMLVFAVIALIGSIAIPSYMRARRRGQTGALMNELRTTADAFQIYLSEKRTLPLGDGSFSTVPAGMANYMPNPSTWTTVPPGGGYWYWYNVGREVWGFSGLIGVYNPRFSPEQLDQIDSSMDDGDPNTGGIRVAGNWVFLGVK